MFFRILGELEIGPEREPVPLPNGHALQVFAGLLFNPNRQLSISELITAAWGDPTVKTPQLHKAASTVRSLLDRVGRKDSLITRRGGGYKLVVREEDLDSLQFTSLVKAADEARGERRTGDEIALLWHAQRLWRGHRPASNVPDHGWPQIAGRLQDRRKRAAVRLFELEMGRRNYEAILDDLASMTQYHATDARLHQLRFVALYRCGFGTEVAEAFERYCDAVMQQTAERSDPAVRDLVYAISRADADAVDAAEERLAARETDRDTRAGVDLVPVPRQMPRPPVTFVGRADLVAEVHWLLHQTTPPTAPVLLISGPAGIGKTALMLHAGHAATKNYPDGQLHVDLRGTAGPRTGLDEVLGGFLRAFGVRHIPEDTAERLSTYRTMTANRRVLILLDDADDEEQVRALIPANPGCAVIVTSRRRLTDIDGAHPVAPLKPLPPRVAMEMFEQLVAVARPGAPAETVATERLVALCAGLPLAIRIAAALRARDQFRSTEELAARLAKHGPEALTTRSSSVSGAIGASYDSLGPGSQSLFLRLALCGLPEFGRWTAAALVADIDVDPATALGALAEYSMVDSVEDPDGIESGRYRFHDLTREYAIRRAAELCSPDEQRELASRAYTALLTLLRRAHHRLCGGDFEVVHADIPEWAAPASALAEVDDHPRLWFRRERRNIRTAVEHCADLGLTQLCWDLAISTHEFYTRDRYFDDWLDTHTSALRACRRAGERRGEAVMLVGLGQPALVASRPSGSLATPADLQHAIHLLAAAGDDHGLAIAKRTLANALRRRGQLAHPLALFTQALAHYEASSDVLGRWQTLRYIGQAHLDRGDPHAALRLLDEALTVATTQLAAEPRPIAQTRYWMGQAYLAIGDLDAARAAFAEIREAFPDPTDSGHAYAVHGLADVARRVGDLDQAEEHLGVAAQLAREAADGTLDGRVAMSLAVLCRIRNDGAGEVAALRHAAECFAAADAMYLHLSALARLSQAEARRGEDAAASAAERWARELYVAMALPEEDRIHRFRAEG